MATPVGREGCPAPWLVVVEACLDRLKHRRFVSPPVDTSTARWEARSRHPLVDQQLDVMEKLAAGEVPLGLPALRTAVYQHACRSWDDPWAYGRVAWCEEATAEVHRMGLAGASTFGAHWEPAWSAWRTAWWIRRAQRASPEVLVHGDWVMGVLHARRQRWEDAESCLKRACEAVSFRPVEGVESLRAAIARRGDP